MVRMSSRGFSVSAAIVGVVGAAAMTVLPSASAQPAASPTYPCFSDVTDVNRVFYDDIQWMCFSTISTGWPVPGDRPQYRPLALTTRGELMSFLYRAKGSPSVTLPAQSPFTDVPTTHPFYRAIVWASQHKIAGGWADGTFRPDGSVLRDQAAAFLYRFAGSPVASPSSAFTDIPATRVFAKEIGWLKSAGITTGWPDGTFRPLEPLRRDTTAAFLKRECLATGACSLPV